MVSVLLPRYSEVDGEVEKTIKLAFAAYPLWPF